MHALTPNSPPRARYTSARVCHTTSTNRHHTPTRDRSSSTPGHALRVSSTQMLHMGKIGTPRERRAARGQRLPPYYSCRVAICAVELHSFHTPGPPSKRTDHQTAAASARRNAISSTHRATMRHTRLVVSLPANPAASLLSQIPGCAVLTPNMPTPSLHAGTYPPANERVNTDAQRPRTKEKKRRGGHHHMPAPG